MRILFDHQIFGWQEYGGVSRYFFELASQLSLMDGNAVGIAAPIYVNKYLRDCPPTVRVFGREVPPIRRGGRVYRAINSLLVRSVIGRFSPDIVHETYYAARRAAPKSAAVVLTVFDMVHEKFARNYSIMDPTSREKASAVVRADHIICISQSTRNDLVELLGVSPEKTSVVYLGSTLPKTFNEGKFKSSQPFILYVGLRQGYKNFSTLLKAYAHSLRLLGNFKLICFGGGRFTAKELKLCAELGVPRQQLVQISGGDEILASLYAGAAVFVYPSLYEGFGIPPLEAMSAGCPVVCGNTSSLPEVVGDAAETCNPDDAEQMRAAIERIVDSSDRARELVTRGFERAERFTWKSCAEETLKVYRRIASGSDRPEDMRG